MTKEKTISLITQGEGINIEFKESKTKLSRDVYGSDVRNLYKYSKIYGGSDPKLIEEDIFKIIVPLKSSDQVTEQVTEQAVIAFCAKPRSTQEIMEHLGLKHREHFRSHILKPLIEKGLLRLTIPDKPNSPNQKYITKDENEDKV